MYVSVDGKIIASASPVNASTGSIRYSTDYGTTFGNGNISLNWQTICGTSQGSRLFAVSSTFGTPSSTTIYQSTNQGATWTQITSPGFASDAYINRMRCSGDGTYLTATDLTSSNNGRYYTSSNSGTTWTARTLSASAGYTHSLCFSRSGSIQYITWATSGNTSSVIYRSFDYGVTFTLVQGHIADGGYWRRIECDATGRFVYATRFNTITSQLFVYRSEDYGTTWAQFNAPGYEDVWISATGQFVVIVSNASFWSTAPYNGVIVIYSSDYGRPDTFAIHSFGQTTTIQTINGSGDGSVLALGSLNVSQSGFAGDGFIRIARQGQQNIQDLSVVGGTIAKSSGVYTLTIPNDYGLVHAGTLTADASTNTYNLTWDVANKINLATHNIKYEIFISFNFRSSMLLGAAFQMGLNGVDSTTIPPPVDTRRRSAVTNWTNIIVNNNTDNTTNEFNQNFIDRFYCGERRNSTWTTEFRNRVHLKGEISMNRRLTGETGITDNSINSRIIVNQFHCEHFVDVGTDDWYIYTQDSTNNTEQYNRIHGTALWNARAGNLWANSLETGISSINIIMQDITTPTTLRPRGAEIQYRIYKVRK